jgi:hypothetical protein
MVSDVGRHTKAAIRDELEQYPGAIAKFHDDGERVRCVLAYRGKQRAFYYSRHAVKPHAVKSVVSDLRHEMRQLGIISKPIGALGEKMVEAARKNGNGSHPIPIRPPPPPLDEEEDDDEPDFGDPPCPDAIAAQRQGAPYKETPMSASVTTLPVPAQGQPPQPSADKVDNRGRNKLDRAAVLRVGNLFVRNGSYDESIEDTRKRLYVYNDGWSDQRIFETAKVEVEIRTIIELRRDYYGFLASEMRPAKDDLTARMAAQDAIIRDLQTRLTKLEQSLGVAG